MIVSDCHHVAAEKSCLAVPAGRQQPALLHLIEHAAIAEQCRVLRP